MTSCAGWCYLIIFEVVMSKRRVVVTGLGVLSPIGVNLDSYWDALVEGKSGVSYLTSVKTNLSRRPIGSEVPDFKPKDYIKPKKNVKVMSRDIQMGVVATLLACQNAGLSFDSEQRNTNPERLGCIFGCDLIGLELDYLKDAFRAGISEGKYDFSTWGSASMANIMPLWMLKYLPNMIASHIAIALDARGPNNTPTLDRGSSLAAFMEACRIIERGATDVMIAGGAGNKINPTILSRSGAYDLAPWSKTPDQDPRPFDTERRGTVIGEGAASFVLENEEFALARGAKPLAVVKGFAEALEPTATFGIEQQAIERAITLALERADMKPEALGHVNANAMGLESDQKEAVAIANALGNQIPVFSATGHFGNLGSGAGAVELVASILALHKGMIPPTRNCVHVDPRCPVNVIREQPQTSNASSFIKLSHANTGRSFALILEKY